MRASGLATGVASGVGGGAGVCPPPRCACGAAQARTRATARPHQMRARDIRPPRVRGLYNAHMRTLTTLAAAAVVMTIIGTTGIAQTDPLIRARALHKQVPLI